MAHTKPIKEKKKQNKKHSKPEVRSNDDVNNTDSKGIVITGIE